MRKTYFFALLAAATLMGSCAPQTEQNPIPANKKEIMDQFVAGTLDPSYIPAAFFVHFGADSKIGEGAVNSHLQFLLASNADILKVQFEQRPEPYSNLDDQATWDAMEPVPEDFYRPTFEVVKRLYEVVGKDVYILPTIYSPYQVARQSLGDDNLAKAAVERREDLKKLFGWYADALIWYVKQCKELGIEGFYMTHQGGEMKFDAIDGFFTELIRPFDLKVMNVCVEGTKMNLLHLCDWEGTFNDLTRFVDYPGQIVNTPNNLNGTPFTLKDGEQLFGRPVLGGLDRHKEIISESADVVKDVVRDAILNGPRGRMMIGAECTVSEAPIENIHAAVSAAHHAGEILQ